MHLGAKYLVFVSSRFVKIRASSAFSVCKLFEESVFIFQFLNNKMHSYVLFDIIVHFNILPARLLYNDFAPI